MGNKKQVRTIKERYGKEFFSDLAGKPHRRGNTFMDPEVRAKAEATRRRNRLGHDEIQVDTDPRD
jgi:hypothetical protein